jgi:uncharacterized membrane protein YozB (DUF420 family)
MPEVLAGRDQRSHPLHHPLQDSLAGVTLVLGLVAIALGFIHSAHFMAAAVGIVGFFLGLYSQMVSATTTERWFNVIGIGTAFVGVGLGLAHGGF